MKNKIISVIAAAALAMTSFAAFAVTASAKNGTVQFRLEEGTSPSSQDGIAVKGTTSLNYTDPIVISASGDKIITTVHVSASLEYGSDSISASSGTVETQIIKGRISGCAVSCINASSVKISAGEGTGYKVDRITVLYTTRGTSERRIVDLSALTGDYTAQDGDVLTGRLSGNYKITVADSAVVTLKDAVIEGENSNEYDWAGITLLGDGTIVLEGTNTVKGFYEDYPGIYVNTDSMLTIQGSGSLTASSNGWAAGIGAGQNLECGDIAIHGGTIKAIGGKDSAGIGGGSGYGHCGDITIDSGIVDAVGGRNSAGIGAGCYSACNNIRIANSVTRVTATKGQDVMNKYYSIGGDYQQYKSIFIGGVATGAISESPFTYPSEPSAAVTGNVTRIVANNEGRNSDGTPDAGATAFITELTKSGDDDVTVNSIKWDIETSEFGRGSFTATGDMLPYLTFSGETSTALIILAVDDLYVTEAETTVTVD